MPILNINNSITTKYTHVIGIISIGIWGVRGAIPTKNKIGKARIIAVLEPTIRLFAAGVSYKGSNSLKAKYQS